MDSKAKFEYWNEISEYDLKTAEAMYNSGRYLYVFLCANNPSRNWLKEYMFSIMMRKLQELITFG